jgi:hypothetical protein
VEAEREARNGELAANRVKVEINLPPPTQQALNCKEIIDTHLKQQESVAFWWEVGLRLGFVRPIDNQWTVATKRCRDFIWKARKVVD